MLCLFLQACFFVHILQCTCTSSCAVKTACIGGEDGVAMQSWAHLEELEGCYQRAAELRSYSLQEQTSFVPPLRLGPKATEDPIFAPIFGQVGAAYLYIPFYCTSA